jgi:hypothetical protein
MAILKKKKIKISKRNPFTLSKGNHFIIYQIVPASFEPKSPLSAGNKGVTTIIRNFSLFL